MATKADFTDTEWKDLSEGPLGLSLVVAAVEPGFLDQFKESWAASQAMVKGASTELERELAKPSMPSLPKGSLQEAQASVTAALQRGLAALEAKAPEEAEPYKQWVMGMADAVANAAGGISDAEAAALAQIKAALG